MKIRESNMEAFAGSAECDFIERVMTHLRENHTVLVAPLPDDVLREMVTNGVARGRSHGLTWESTLTAFVALMFEVAPNFDEHPKVRAGLEAPFLEPDERIQYLPDYVGDEAWREAEQNYDESAWFPDDA